jgi:hypothetical protein
MQESQPFGSLLDKVLRMGFIEAMWLLFQRLQQIAPATQVEDDVEAVGILKVLFRLHHVRMAPHQLCKADLAEGHLTEFYGARLLCLCKLALVEHLNSEVPIGGEALSLVHSSKQSALKSPYELIFLPASLDIGAHHLWHWRPTTIRVAVVALVHLGG